MLTIEQIGDPDKLRRVALLLDRTVEQLQERVRDLWFEDAQGPLKVIPGGRYSPDFMVHTAIQKFCDHLPLERQVDIAARHGLVTTSQALWNQLEAGAVVLWPTNEALGAWLLMQPVLHADETGWPVQADDEEKPRWTAWCLCSHRGEYLREASPTPYASPARR